MTFTSANEGWALILSQVDRDVEVLHSVDGGVNWSSPVTVAPLNQQPDASPHIGIRFANAQVGFVFGDGIYATADGGQTWTDTGAPGDVLDIAAAGGSVWAITGCDPRHSSCATNLMAWDTTARKWRPMPHQPPVSAGPLRLIRMSARQAFVVQETLMDTRLARTDDGGNTWARLNTPCIGFGMPVATVDGVHLWMVCAGEPGAGQQLKSVYTSSDGGSTWTLRASAESTAHVGTLSSSGYAQSLAAASSNMAFMTMNRGDLYRTIDGGRTWTPAGISGGEGFFPALDFVDATHGWVVAQVFSMEGRVGLYRTTDAGAHWTLASSMPGNV